jgi:hypothetical protein
LIRGPHQSEQRPCVRGSFGSYFVVGVP